MTAPLIRFEARCYDCLEVVPNRPEPHVCRDEQTRAEDAIATPWRGARRG